MVVMFTGSRYEGRGYNEVAHNLQNKPKRKTEKVIDMSTSNSERYKVLVPIYDDTTTNINLKKALTNYLIHTRTIDRKS
jgi:hypothetical protein